MFVFFQLYRKLKVRVVLTEAITWTNGNQISVSSDPSTLLNEFKRYRRRISTQHDSAMLLTYVYLTSVYMHTFKVSLTVAFLPTQWH